MGKWFSSLLCTFLLLVLQGTLRLAGQDALVRGGPKCWGTRGTISGLLG